MAGYGQSYVFMPSDGSNPEKSIYINREVDKGYGIPISLIDEICLLPHNKIKITFKSYENGYESDYIFKSKNQYNFFANYQKFLAGSKYIQMVITPKNGHGLRTLKSCRPT